MSYSTKLIEDYRKKFDVVSDRPDWVVKIKDSNQPILPTIPFVGKNYEDTRLLLYASAENLTSYEKGNELLEDSNKSINRHRVKFDIITPDFYPKVHLSPITDGSLVCVASYLLKGKKEFKSPRDLLESIAFGNFGKFAIETSSKKNRDYPKDIDKLKCSFDYIRIDLEILKPQIVIIPKSIYAHSLVKELFQKIKIYPIYQINSGTINRTIINKYDKMDISKTGLSQEWIDNLQNGITGKTRQNFMSVFTYLDSIKEKVRI